MPDENIPALGDAREHPRSIEAVCQGLHFRAGIGRYNPGMENKLTPDEMKKAIAFFVMMGISTIAGLCAIVEMTYWSAGPFTCAFLTIFVLRGMYSAISMFNRWTDPRYAKKPKSSPELPDTDRTDAT